MIKFVGKSIVTNTAEMICEKYFTSNTNRQHQICGENSSDSPKINERPYSRSCYGRLTGFHGKLKHFDTIKYFSHEHVPVLNSKF